jgi:hypothetical protein
LVIGISSYATPSTTSAAGSQPAAMTQPPLDVGGQRLAQADASIPSMQAPWWFFATCCRESAKLRG